MHGIPEQSDTTMSNGRPNFLIIVADDLGFSDTGPYGGEIETPTLDRLAKDGVQMTNFHTAAACSPTRSMLMSGTDNHIAGLGAMAESMKHFGLGRLKGKPGYEGYLNFRVAALPEVLQDNGYLTLMSGKWHLGLEKHLAPCSRGFTKSYSFLPGAGNHYAWEPQFADDEFRTDAMQTKGYWMDEDEFVGLPAKGFYSTTSFTDRMLSYLEGRTDNELEQPFFAYLPFTAPHWPLQAPREIIDKYKGKYDDGPDVLAQERLKRLIELGLVDKDSRVPPASGTLLKEWDEMSEDEKNWSARTMECFAGMVDSIDQNIGRVVDYLEKSGELDRTFILFMSDNGAEGMEMEALPIMGKGPETFADIKRKHYDQSLENLGNYNSFPWYGPRWASAGTAPNRGLKTYPFEGGIRCPCLLRFPPLKTTQESISHSFTTVMDIFPTILELAGIAPVGEKFRDRDVVLPRGKSWCEHLGGLHRDASSATKHFSVHGEDTHIHGWELFDGRAIREGNWKAVYLPMMGRFRGTGKWELYNLSDDPSEQNDLADAEPAKMERLMQLWSQYVLDVGRLDSSTDFVTDKGAGRK